VARRRQARRRAVDILYQADVMGRDPVGVLEERRSVGEKIPGFTEDLVRGTSANLTALDRLLGEHAEGWTVQRMAAVDRTLLRVACYEILYQRESPAVAISEAVVAAKELSTEDSGRFVNGILGRIARERAGTG
jgi:transcription antitermination protein NusB